MRRGSTRAFVREAISFGQLSTALDRALRGLNADFSESPEALLSEPYLIVNAVDGLAPVYHGDRQALELLRAGNFRVTDFFLPHAQGKSVMFLITLGKKRQRP